MKVLLSALGIFFGAAMLANCGAPRQEGASTAFVPVANGALHLSGTERILHSFVGGSDGQYPEAAPIVIGSELYGTTGNGGNGGCAALAGCGTVYKVSMSGQEQILHAFGRGDGEAPTASLIDVNDKLYGTTRLGGGFGCKGARGHALGCGTIFEITTSGKMHVLYRFSGRGQGAMPTAPLLFVNGAYYGEATGGGIGPCYYADYPGCGLIFEMSSSGHVSVLYTFQGSPNDGGTPQGGLVLFKGNFYGTTGSGGKYGSNCLYSYGCGTVFRMTPSGSETVLYSFQDYPDGALPLSGLVVLNGALYGTTFSGGTNNCALTGSFIGCGTVFKITPSGKKQTIYDFHNSGTDGEFPNGLIAVGGNLYGTTEGGGGQGSGMGQGTVFKLTPYGHETILYRFKGYPDAGGPTSGLLNVHGTFYGTTQGGGASRIGAVYSLIP